MERLLNEGHPVYRQRGQGKYLFRQGQEKRKRKNIFLFPSDEVIPGLWAPLQGVMEVCRVQPSAAVLLPVGVGDLLFPEKVGMRTPPWSCVQVASPTAGASPSGPEARPRRRLGGVMESISEYLTHGAEDVW